MKKSDFNFDLPEELIAQTPLEKRDNSRLLHLNKETGELEHGHFYDIKKYLKPGDCLVLNDSRVLPARLIGARPTGGSVELVLLRDLGDGCWECLSRPGRKTKPGQEIVFGDGELTATVQSVVEGGNRIVKFNYNGEDALKNPIFMKTNYILAAAWGVLYICISAVTYFLYKYDLRLVSILVSNISPVVMGIFTGWFVNWYPAHVARR